MSTITQRIYEASFGNLKAIDFKNENQVLSKLDDIRSKMKIKDTDIYGFDMYLDPAQDRFKEIYDIAPYILIELLKN